MTMIRLRAALLVIALIACAAHARAQQYMPMPPGTLMGNVTTHANPGNAVTLPQLVTALSGLGVITSQSMSGDCTMAVSGVITCTPPLSRITGIDAGAVTWLGSPSGANLLAALTTKTGTGLPVFGTAPNITSPTGIVKGDVGLGNVSNVDTTNAANLSSGTLPAARMPALTGDCTTSAGAVATTCTSINGVNQTTAWSAFTSSPVCGTATITTNSSRSKTLGKTVFVQVEFTITAIGSCTSAFSFTLPVTAQSGGGLAGQEITAGHIMACRVVAGSATSSCAKTTPATDPFLVNDHFIASGVFESQ